MVQIVTPSSPYLYIERPAHVAKKSWKPLNTRILHTYPLLLLSDAKYELSYIW